MDKGFSYEEIAEILLLDEVTIGSTGRNIKNNGVDMQITQKRSQRKKNSKGT